MDRKWISKMMNNVLELIKRNLEKVNLGECLYMLKDDEIEVLVESYKHDGSLCSKYNFYQYVERLIGAK